MESPGKAPAKARPLAQKQLDRLRERLQEEWEAAARSANLLDAEIFESGRNSDAKSYGAHIAESASIGSAQEVARAQSRIEAQILVGIQQALKRVEDKTYGQCERCSDPIGYARLSAKPWASFCMNCKRELEKGAS
jgi:DnaK suppressor protein